LEPLTKEDELLATEDELLEDKKDEPLEDFDVP
jgi:hypothetical protein